VKTLKLAARACTLSSARRNNLANQADQSERTPQPAVPACGFHHDVRHISQVMRWCLQTAVNEKFHISVAARAIMDLGGKTL
jgi:hypothetical protein